MTLTDKHSIRVCHLGPAGPEQRPPWPAQIENPYLDRMGNKAICLTAALVFSTQEVAGALRTPLTVRHAAGNGTQSS